MEANPAAAAVGNPSDVDGLAELTAALRDFEVEIKGVQAPVSSAQEVTPYSETEWLHHLELKFVLRALRKAALKSLGDVASGTARKNSVIPGSFPLIENLLEKIEAQEQTRLAITGSQPLVLRLAAKYGLTGSETDYFQLLFMRGASKSLAVRAFLKDGGRSKDKEWAMDLCGMSFVEVEEFLDDKRTHMSEGIVLLEDDFSRGKGVRMMNEAISVLLLRPLKTEQRLKLSKTELLTIMESAQVGSLQDGYPTAVVNGDGSGHVPEEQSSALLERDDRDQLKALDVKVNGGLRSQMKRLSLPCEVGGDAADVINGHGTAGSVHSQDFSKSRKGELQPYTSSLEYLDDAFQVLALKLRISKARHKEAMKEALNDERSWYGSTRTSKVSTIRELQAKERFQLNRMHERMKLTEEGFKNGAIQLPRLEALARKLGLDEFEKSTVVMLTAISISPVVKSIFESKQGDGSYRHTDAVQVKDLLIVYFQSFKEQVLARTYFYKSSRLVSRGLIKMRASSSYSRGGGDLMDQHVELDRRMLDWIVGLDTEMNELVEGSHLYTPKISMGQVVLPAEQKEMLLTTVDNFANFRKYRKTAGLDDVISYGAGLIIMLCGSSGTGKTMTVNAIAHHLGKRVLLVDFHSLHSSSKHKESDQADVRGLFRDAEMNDAIVFFDECEAIFTKRERGGDKLFNSLLTEMERHEGIIMLATNRPLDLDEAMHRRITYVSEFHNPDHMQRCDIWKLSAAKLPVGENIEWGKIALRYELTGGYIKNALVSALLAAIARESENPSITEEDIISGCRLQMRGSLQMKSFSHRVVPTRGMEDLVLSNQMRERLDAIIRFEKARAVLLGQWGFQQELLGTACLFWGPHGTGKSVAAEAIGFELGRPLKVVNCAQLLQKDEKKSGSKITTTFKDTRLMDAVLVLEDFQIFKTDGSGGVGSVSAFSDLAIGLLLHELERFPGICILIANNIQGSILHRLDPELTRRLRFLVEFKMPDKSGRARIWQSMIPKKAPLSDNIDFEELGRRFDFASGTISNAIVRAAAKAALRTGDKRIITQKDLVDAAEAERAESRDEVHDVMLRQFI